MSLSNIAVLLKVLFPAAYMRSDGGAVEYGGTLLYKSIPDHRV